MTILFSVYTATGVVVADDDRITQQLGKSGLTRTMQLKPQHKVLPVEGLGVHKQGGLVGFFGMAMVGKQTMESWLTDFPSSGRARIRKASPTI
jgi:hypothetical protein